MAALSQVIKGGCVHYSLNTKWILSVLSQMNTLKVLGETPPVQFLSVLLCACTCFRKVGRRGEFLLSCVHTLALVSLWQYALFLSFSVFLPFPVSSFFFTHLFDGGHSEINILCPREKAACLACFSLFPSIFHIFNHSFFKVIMANEMPVSLCLYWLHAFLYVLLCFFLT